MTNIIPIQKFESNEITMEEFLELVLENGLDYNIEWDDEKYFITLNNLGKMVQLCRGDVPLIGGGSGFIYLELIP